MKENNKLPYFFKYRCIDELKESAYQICIDIKRGKLNEDLYDLYYTLDKGFKDLLYSIEPSEILSFIEYHYNPFKGEKQKFLIHVNYLIDDYRANLDNIHSIKSLGMDADKISIIDNKNKIVLEWIANNKEEIDFGGVNKIEKIKWNGKPAQIGYLFKELVDKGWITLPMTSQKENVKKLSRLCQQYFDVKTDSPESFYHEFLSFNSLSPMAKYFFQLKDFRES